MDFQFYLDYVLENEFVRLSPLMAEHRADLLRYSVDEPELWTYSLSGAAGEECLTKYIEYALEAREREISYPFVVYDKLNGVIAGSTRFADISISQKTLSIGYTWYGKKFQGTVLNKSCKYLLLEFAFGKMRMERVEFRADARNERSIAAMKSIGCTLEGVLRSNGFTRENTRRDSVVLSILRREWEEGIKSELASKIWKY